MANAARATIMLLGLGAPVDTFGVSVGVPVRAPLAGRAAVARAGQPRAFDGKSDPPHLVARDALMHRAVEQQISSFAVIHDTARKAFLYNAWKEFLEGAQKPSSPGKLTNFIGTLQRAETTSIFVPKRLFRQLSPNNPYAAAQQDGEHEVVRPQEVAMRLITCREQLAEYWVDLMPSLTQPSKLGTVGASDAAANATAAAPSAGANTTATSDSAALGSASESAALGETAAPGESAYDRQLLLGIATKLAVRRMLHELSLRPSCRLLHDWLNSYLLVTHANDFTALGSVERLHADLVAQPICIYGGALFDPSDISLELFQRSYEILERIEEDLRYAPEHIVPLTADFFESCWKLDSL